MSQINLPENPRQSDHPIESLILQRWSPRAMSGEPLSQEELLTLFEAARWAPSTYNEQEWRFLYGRRDTPQWPLFFDLLVEFNQSWCRNAAVLVVVLARKTFTRNNKPNAVHLFDAGAAWENLALQAAAMGLVSHGMMGFDFDKARAHAARAGTLRCGGHVCAGPSRKSRRSPAGDARTRGAQRPPAGRREHLRRTVCARGLAGNRR